MIRPVFALSLLLLVQPVVLSKVKKYVDGVNDLACVARCAPFEILTCSGRKLYQAYSQMRESNCLNCDRYFHCIGNYRAVNVCSNRDRSRRVAIATKISDCRERCQGGGADSDLDQEANRIGRNDTIGGECAKKYLCKSRCAYNPTAPADRNCEIKNCMP